MSAQFWFSRYPRKGILRKRFHKFIHRYHKAKPPSMSVGADSRGLRYVSAVCAQSLSSKKCLSTSQMIRTMTSTTIFFISSRISSIVITSFPDLRDRRRITTAALYNRRKDLSNKKAPATSRGFRVSETRKIIRQFQFNRDWRRHVQDFFQEAWLGRAVGDGEIFFGAVKHFGD